MKLISSLAGGLAGAITVTIIHEVLRKTSPHAPRLDETGKQLTKNILQKAGRAPLSERQAYRSSLVGELLANAVYFSLAGSQMKHAFRNGGLLGLTAGLSAATLPSKLGLNGNGAHSNGAHKKSGSSKKWITIGLYLAGGLVSAAVARWLENRNKQSIVSPLNPPVESYKPVIDITV
jgi:hypothetical protein